MACFGYDSELHKEIPRFLAKISSQAALTTIWDWISAGCYRVILKIIWMDTPTAVRLELSEYFNTFKGSKLRRK